MCRCSHASECTSKVTRAIASKHGRVRVQRPDLDVGNRRLEREEEAALEALGQDGQVEVVRLAGKGRSNTDAQVSNVDRRETQEVSQQRRARCRRGTKCPERAMYHNRGMPGPPGATPRVGRRGSDSLDLPGGGPACGSRTAVGAPAPAPPRGAGCARSTPRGSRGPSPSPATRRPGSCRQPKGARPRPKPDRVPAGPRKADFKKARSGGYRGSRF